jgi:hypothetical protein
MSFMHSKDTLVINFQQVTGLLLFVKNAIDHKRSRLIRKINSNFDIDTQHGKNAVYQRPKKDRPWPILQGPADACQLAVSASA